MALRRLVSLSRRSQCSVTAVDAACRRRVSSDGLPPTPPPPEPPRSPGGPGIIRAAGDTGAPTTLASPDAGIIEIDRSGLVSANPVLPPENALEAAMRVAIESQCPAGCERLLCG